VTYDDVTSDYDDLLATDLLGSDPGGALEAFEMPQAPPQAALLKPLCGADIGLLAMPSASAADGRYTAPAPLHRRLSPSAAGGAEGVQPCRGVAVHGARVPPCISVYLRVSPSESRFPGVTR
jgi:hypothetical protein